jgi:hypothetical protein
MNQDDKQRLLDRQMQGIAKGTAAYRQVEEMCIGELDDLEPIFDQIVERELKDCIALIAKFMTPEERLSLSRRLNECAGRGSGFALANPEQEKTRVV